MDNTNQQMLDFLKENPGATKANLATEFPKLKGLPLFNTLKKLIKDGLVTEAEGEEPTYFAAQTENKGSEAQDGHPATTSSTDVVEEATEGSVAQSSTQDALANEQEAVQSIEAPATEKPKELITSGRDSSKYKFNGQELGKGPLVRAIVAQYVKDHPGIDVPALKEIFPDALMKRFGIFQDVETAKKIAKGGRRYFFNESQLISLEDEAKTKLAVTNQWTLANLQPFLKVAKELGYVIE